MKVCHILMTPGAWVPGMQGIKNTLYFVTGYYYIGCGELLSKTQKTTLLVTMENGEQEEGMHLFLKTSSLIPSSHIIPDEQ